MDTARTAGDINDWIVQHIIKSGAFVPVEATQRPISTESSLLHKDDKLVRVADHAIIVGYFLAMIHWNCCKA